MVPFSEPVRIPVRLLLTVPALTWPLPEQVAIVRCPVGPSSSTTDGLNRARSDIGGRHLPPVRSSHRDAQRAHISGRCAADGPNLGTATVAPSVYRQNHRRTQQQQRATQRLPPGGHGRGSLSAPPVQSTNSTTVAAVAGMSDPVARVRNGVDLGRNGLPVSLARALAMEGQAPGRHQLYDTHPRARRQELRLRLGTSVRGRRLTS
jgi:hypothetical protein